MVSFEKQIKFGSLLSSSYIDAEDAPDFLYDFISYEILAHFLHRIKKITLKAILVFVQKSPLI